MALVNMTGFEIGATEMAAVVGTQAAIASDDSRSGSYALKVTASGGANSDHYYELRGYDATGAMNTAINASTLYVQFRFKVSSVGPGINQNIFSVYGGGAVNKCYVRLIFRNIAGWLYSFTLALYDTNGTLVQTVQGSYGIGQWHLVRLKVPTGVSSTNWDLSVNGVSTPSKPAANFTTGTGSSVRVGRLTTSGSSSSATGLVYYIDDLIIRDDAFPTASRVITLRPTGQGTDNGWVLGAGSTKPLAVSDTTPDEDVTYVSASGAASESYNMQDSSAFNISTIETVMPIIVAKSSGSYQLRMRSGATLYTSTAATGSAASYRTAARLTDTDPNTSASWTTTGLDAVQVGIRSYTPATDYALTAAYLNIACTTTATVGLGLGSTLALTSIASTETFGTIFFGTLLNIGYPPSVASGETFGVTTIFQSIPMAVSSIPSSFSMGSPSLIAAMITAYPPSVFSAESFGNARFVSAIAPDSIASSYEINAPNFAFSWRYGKIRANVYELYEISSEHSPPFTLKGFALPSVFRRSTPSS